MAAFGWFCCTHSQHTNIKIKIKLLYIERVFSELKLIRDEVGDSMLDDITEVRLLVQYNG